MNPKLLKRDIGVSETTLKRTKATRLDIAVLAEQMQDLKADTCRDVEASRTSLQALDEKISVLDVTVDSVGRNISQCQSVIAAVKETLDAQTGRLTMALRESEEQQHGRSVVVDERLKSMDGRMTATDERLSAMDERMNEMSGSINEQSGRINEMSGSINDLGGRINEISGSINDLSGRIHEMTESVRSIEEKNIRESEAVQSRIQALEHHLPKLEAEMKALDGKADRIEQVQQKINARIVTVMRMSLAIIGVVVVTAIVFGFFLRR